MKWRLIFWRQKIQMSLWYKYENIYAWIRAILVTEVDTNTRNVWRKNYKLSNKNVGFKLRKYITLHSPS